MRFKIYSYLNSLEEKINDGISVSLFKGYKAIKKRGVEKIIDEIYSDLPTDVRNAQTYLQSKKLLAKEGQKCENIYNSLKNFETTFNTFVSFADIVVINIKEMEKLINKIYDSIPEEISRAENLDK
jgi:hypothetical protein